MQAATASPSAPDFKKAVEKYVPTLKEAPPPSLLEKFQSSMSGTKEVQQVQQKSLRDRVGDVASAVGQKSSTVAGQVASKAGDLASATSSAVTNAAAKPAQAAARATRRTLLVALLGACTLAFAYGAGSAMPHAFAKYLTEQGKQAKGTEREQ